jgi:hypothetical protein
MRRDRPRRKSLGAGYRHRLVAGRLQAEAAEVASTPSRVAIPAAAHAASARVLVVGTDAAYGRCESHDGIGVQAGTAGDGVVNELPGRTSADVGRVESVPLAIGELDSGCTDAMAIENGVPVNHVTSNPDAASRAAEDPFFHPARESTARRRAPRRRNDAGSPGRAGQGCTLRWPPRRSASTPS